MTKGMKIYLYILFLFLIPSLSFSQIVISGNGEIVASGTANIILSGDWTNNATNMGFTASNGVGAVEFNGSAIQTIKGSINTNFTNLQIDNLSGVNIDKTASINKLEFINGIINTSPLALISINDGGTVSGADNTKFINGPLSKVGNEDFKFDVGDGNKYAPIKATNISIATNVVAEYHHAVAPNPNNLTSPLQRVSHVEYWTLNDSNQLGTTANVELFWENADSSGIKSIDPDTLKFVSYDTSSWQASDHTIIKGSVGNASGSIVSLSAINLLARDLTFGTTDRTNNPLPITLISFTANCLSHGIELDWSTAAEFNDDYFTILRSSSIDNYKEVGVVTGSGNSDQVLNYSFTDWSATHDEYYYVLEQTDYDGTHKFYHPIEIDCKYTNHAEASVYPNPTQGIVVINSSESELESLNVYNLLGQKITGQIKIISRNLTTSIDLSKLRDGYYTIKTKTGSYKICKQQ